MVRAAIVMLLLALMPSAAQAEKRIALLIGNQSYASESGRLANPKHRHVGTATKGPGVRDDPGGASGLSCGHRLARAVALTEMHIDP